MNLEIINQQAGTNAFHQRLENVLAHCSTPSEFRVLTAFVKMSGLNLISQALVDYLERGGCTKWIVGIDLGLTSAEALRYLSWLKTRFQEQVDVKIFTAGTNNNVFHPKFYMLKTSAKLVAWVGSANVTGGGMFSNFECIVELNIDPIEDEDVAVLFETVWASYVSPQSSSVRLLEVDPKLISEIEKSHGPEQATESLVLEHPLSFIDQRVLPKAPLPPRLKSDGSPQSLGRLQSSGNELIMEILTETRETQVQIPVKVLTQFFGVRRDEKAVITLKNKRTGESKNRRIVHHRGMHRVEMEFIKGLTRPLIIRLERDLSRQDTYQYELLKRGSREFRRMRRLLLTQGYQTHSRARRWLVR